VRQGAARRTVLKRVSVDICYSLCTSATDGRGEMIERAEGQVCQ
jgi:hypothetical protein